MVNSLEYLSYKCKKLLWDVWSLFISKYILMFVISGVKSTSALFCRIVTVKLKNEQSCQWIAFYVKANMFKQATGVWCIRKLH